MDVGKIMDSIIFSAANFPLDVALKDTAEFVYMQLYKAEVNTPGREVRISCGISILNGLQGKWPRLDE